MSYTNDEKKLKYYAWLCNNIKNIINAGVLSEREFKEFNLYFDILANPDAAMDDKHLASIVMEDKVFKYSDIFGIPLEPRDGKKRK